jgi:hypothetical protein
MSFPPTSQPTSPSVSPSAAASVSTENDVELASLSAQIENLCETTGFLSHRIHTMERALEQETFQLDSHPIKVASTAKAAHVEDLLAALKLSQDNLTLGKFLRALNKYLVHEDLVDLNDLQIKLSPLIVAAFQKPKGLKKVPYALLLMSLPRMFE